jgi:hypothetical protein
MGTATVRGIVVEHEGKEYLVTVDQAGLPELCERGANGDWNTLKKKGREGRAGHTAEELLHALDQTPPAGDHTQQHIKNLVIFCINRIISTFFEMSRW